jgi:hypothetical protein
VNESGSTGLVGDSSHQQPYHGSYDRNDFLPSSVASVPAAEQSLVIDRPHIAATAQTTVSGPRPTCSSLSSLMSSPLASTTSTSGTARPKQMAKPLAPSVDRPATSLDRSLGAMFDSLTTPTTPPVSTLSTFSSEPMRVELPVKPQRTVVPLQLSTCIEEPRTSISEIEDYSDGSFELLPTATIDDGTIFPYVSREATFDNTVVLPTFASQENSYKLLMTVRGNRHYGLVVDPGAARGVIGVDTYGEIWRKVLSPRRLVHSIKWRPSNSRFSGISSMQQVSLGLCDMPIGLQGVDKSTFSADVLGGDASWCPGLVPLHSLMSSAEFMHFSFFSNGDGVLGVRYRNTCRPQRLLLTDSGHYLLRIDLFGVATDPKLNQALADRLYSHLLGCGQPRQSQRHRSGREHIELAVMYDGEEDASVFR